MPVDLEKLISEVVGEMAPSLLVCVTVTDGCTTTGCYGSVLYRAASGTVGVLVLLSDALGISFPIARGL